MRRVAKEHAAQLAELHPVLARIYAARGIVDATAVDHRLARLTDPRQLGGIERACDLLLEAIDRDLSIMIAGDYDCDGATGVAVAVRGLKLLGARRIGYVVPDRFIHGYGLTPALVASLETTPDLLVTVDNGTSSIDGVAAARARGSRVLITDHHLAGPQLPEADAIVNPRVRGKGLENLAGVGVMFYVLLALRARLRELGRFSGGREPDLSALLDLVALGTVADLVPLDHNNRILVEAGLRRIRAGRASVGIQALARAARRDCAALASADLGFALGPRVNAAGRLDDMRIGIECLLCDDPARADALADALGAINGARRDLQSSMLADAEDAIAQARAHDRIGITLFDADWHAGVVGLVASRVKDELNRPVIAFAPAGNGSANLRGSARSIAGFHIRDALAEIDSAAPGMIVRFGGHAMAAGLELPAADLGRFAQLLDQVARARIDADALERVIWCDGSLEPGDIEPGLAALLRHAAPWGQAFAAPLFADVFECTAQRVMGAVHRRLELRDPRDGRTHDGVMFNVKADLPLNRPTRMVYELGINEWMGRSTLRLLVRHVDAA